MARLGEYENTFHQLSSQAQLVVEFHCKGKKSFYHNILWCMEPLYAPTSVMGLVVQLSVCLDEYEAIYFSFTIQSFCQAHVFLSRLVRYSLGLIYATPNDTSARDQVVHELFRILNHTTSRVVAPPRRGHKMF